MAAKSVVPGLLRRRSVQVAVGALALLIGARALLPIAIQHYVNDTLDGLEGYSGEIEDVDLQLLRGAYEIEGLRLVKTSGQVPAPFLSADEVDLSVQWSELLNGAVVAEIVVDGPVLNFVTGKDPEREQVSASSNWKDTVRELVPIEINRLEARNGEIHYRDFDSEPNVDIYVQKLNAAVRNLTNSKDLSGSLVASFELEGIAMGSGQLELDGKLDPFAEQPTFDLQGRLDTLDLRSLNDYLRAYANLDVERGRISIDVEAAAEQGGFKGYVKPFVKDLDVLRWQKEDESFFNKIWQGAADLIGELLEDQPRDRIATKVPLRGSVDDLGADAWSAIGGLLKNAFIESLRRGIEGSIGLGGAGEREG